MSENRALVSAERPGSPGTLDAVSRRNLRGANADAIGRGDRVRDRAPVGRSGAFTLSDGQTLAAEYDDASLSSHQCEQLATAILVDADRSPDRDAVHRRWSPIAYRWNSKAEVVPTDMTDDGSGIVWAHVTQADELDDTVRAAVHALDRLEHAGSDIERDAIRAAFVERHGVDLRTVDRDALDVDAAIDDDADGRFSGKRRVRPMPSRYRMRQARPRKDERPRVVGRRSVVFTRPDRLRRYAHRIKPWHRVAWREVLDMEVTALPSYHDGRVTVGHGPWRDRTTTVAEQRKRDAARRKSERDAFRAVTVVATDDQYGPAVAAGLATLAQGRSFSVQGPSGEVRVSRGADRVTVRGTMASLVKRSRHRTDVAAVDRVASAISG